MIIDPNLYDAAISMAKTRNPSSRFAVEVTIAGNMHPIRTAANLEAHTHVVQGTALLTGLALLRLKRPTHSRVLITSGEQPFVHMLRRGRIDHLAIPDAMKDKLKMELSEVIPDFVFNAAPKFIISLEKWLRYLPLDILGDQGLMQQKAAA
jgi:hypothetical protein